MQMIRAVIFDMDGVVTDSERLGWTALIQAGRQQGVELTQPFIRSTMGMTFASSKAMYAKCYPTLDHQKLISAFNDRMCALARSGELPLMKGVVELLDTLDEKRIPCALASSSKGDIVRIYLSSNGVYDRFTKIISGEMCERSKPDPDIFLKAARALNVRPADCLVLEDSVNGLKAGRAAGMQVCMVPDQIPYSDALKPYCDHVLKSLLDVREML